MKDAVIKESDPAVMEGFENEGYSGSENDLRNGTAVEQSRDKVTTNKDSPETDDDSEEFLCGLGSWKPKCLQAFNNPKAVLAFLCLFAFTQGK